MREVDDLFHEYCLLEFPKFLPKIIKPELYQRLMARADELQIAKTPERVVALRIKEEFGNSIWGALVIAAQPVPSDPDEVIDLVQRDRDIIYGERKMAKAPAKNEAPAAEKAPKEKKEPKPQLVRGHAMSAIMSFGQDAEGKSFGPKNNPKREGSASAARFALYKPGKPLSAQLGQEGGPTLDDLKFDSDPKRNWIVITD
jgi:hypothetical protein